MIKDKKLRVAVLFGGDSSEREISIESGNCVAAALESVGFNVRNWGGAVSSTCGFALSVGDVERAAGSLPPIDPDGGTSTQQNISLGRFAPGTHEVRLTVDPAQEVEEADEDNNALSFPIEVVRGLTAADSCWILYR